MGNTIEGSPEASEATIELNHEPTSLEESDSSSFQEKGKKDEKILVDWWGHKHGFVFGGLLGEKSQSSSQKRKSFGEEDQENLYKLVQDKATSGKQGLGIKDHHKKIAGVDWQGKKKSFNDSDDDQSVESGDYLKKRKWQKDLQSEIKVEPKTKLKSLCKKLLRQVPSQSIKLKQMKVLVEAHSVSVFSKFSSKHEALSYLKQKLEGSKTFLVEGKIVSLAR